MDSEIPLLILSGPVGVGKTIVGHELSNQLVEDGIPTPSASTIVPLQKRPTMY